MFLQQQPGFQAPTMTEIVLAAAGLFSTVLNWRLASVASDMKLRLKEESEMLRRELGARIDALSDKFVPGSLDSERRSVLSSKVEEVRGEVQRNRERIHEQANKIQEILLGPIENVHNSLRDKAKRLTSLEERERAGSDKVRAIEDDIRELHERLNDLDRDRDRERK